MPDVFGKDWDRGKSFLLVTSFGELSLLEVASVLQGKLAGVERLSPSVVRIKLSQPDPQDLRKLSGIYKLASPMGSLSRAAGFAPSSRDAHEVPLMPEKGNVSLSLYGANRSDYDGLLEAILQRVHSAGMKKAKVVRPKNGTEVQAAEVVSRDTADFVACPSGDRFELGLVTYLPDPVPFKARSTLRPSVHSDISMSPRLAKCLVNISGAGPGEVLLDPFCGAGTILMEAVSLGVDCIGIDKDPRRIAEAERNLAWLRRTANGRLGDCVLKVGDALDLRHALGGRKVGAVVTEPILLPKFSSMPTADQARRSVGRSSSIYEKALSSVSEALAPGGRFVVVVPSLTTRGGGVERLLLGGDPAARLSEYSPGWQPRYPVEVGQQSTRWVRRSVYAFVRL